MGTYIRKYELTWRGGDIHTNEQMDLEGVTYIRTNKIGGGDVHTNEQTNTQTWMGGLTHEQTNIFFLTPNTG